MTPALTPALALDLLHSLSADVRDGVVLDEAGERRAGSSGLVDAARYARSELGAHGELEARTSRGVLLAVAEPGGLVMVRCGPQVLGGLGRLDLRLALADLLDSPPNCETRLTTCSEPLAGVLAVALDGLPEP